MDKTTPINRLLAALGVELIPSVVHTADRGYSTNPEALKISQWHYPAVVIDGVKIGLSATDIFVNSKNGRVYIGDPSVSLTDTVVIAGVVTPPDRRRQGLATHAMYELCRAATECGVNLKLEPCPIEAYRVKGQRLPTVNRLRKFYAKFGFEGTQIMERRCH